MNINDTIHINYITGKTTVSCVATDKTLEQIWQSKISQFDRPVVLVSGGLDSQLAANVVKKYAKNASAIIYDLVWNHNTINGQDLVMAQKFCDSIQLPYKVKTVDLTDFLDHQLLEFGRKYKVSSPQVASLLYAIAQTNFPKGSQLVMGGEPHFVTKDSAGNAALSIISDTNHKSGLFINYYAPFQLLAEDLGISILRDINVVSPEAQYQSIRHNIDVITRHKKIGVSNSNSLKDSMWQYKNIFYDSFDYDFILPLAKKTGFESIQIHLAAASGVYDQFNVLYRTPLENICRTEKWYNPNTSIVFVGGGVEYIMDQAHTLVNDTELTDISVYKIAW